jgi:hypothetical protein
MNMNSNELELLRSKIQGRLEILESANYPTESVIVGWQAGRISMAKDTLADIVVIQEMNKRE